MAVALGTISGRLMRRPNNRVGEPHFILVVIIGGHLDNGQIALFPVKSGDFKAPQQMSLSRLDSITNN